MTTPPIEGLDLSNAVSVAVARKALDAQRDQGAQVVELIRQAGQAGQQARQAPNTPSPRGGVDLYA